MKRESEREIERVCLCGCKGEDEILLQLKLKEIVGREIGCVRVHETAYVWIGRERERERLKQSKPWS